MAYKLLYLARRAATVSREEWPRTWKSHAIFASQFPVLEAKIDWMRYCNRLDADLPGLSTAHDGVGICAGATLDGLTGAGFTAQESALIDGDELRVFDQYTRHFAWYCEERTLLDGPLGEVALFTFLARKPGLSREQFWQRWQGEHATLAARITPLAGITRYCHNQPVNPPLPKFPFDAIAEAWFANVDAALQALTGDQLTHLRSDLAEFCDLGQSTAIMTSVCHRWPKA